jgi:hypothetical protein
MLYTQIYDETRKSKSKRKVQGEIKGETVSFDLPRPSGPYALIGGAPALSWLVGPRRAALYRQVEVSGTGYEIHRPPPPHQQVNPSRSRLSAAATGSSTPAIVYASASTPSPWTQPGPRPPRARTPSSQPPRAPALHGNGEHDVICCHARARRYTPWPPCLSLFLAQLVLASIFFLI